MFLSDPINFRFDKMQDLIKEHSSGQKTNSEYLSLTHLIYGEKKVDEVCSRYGIFSKTYKTKPLILEHLTQLHTGLNDVTIHDLENLLNKIKSPLSLTIRENEVIKNFDSETLKQFQDYSNISHLPAELFNQLLDSLLKTNITHSNTQLLLSKISGIPSQYFKHGWVSHVDGRSAEDGERLRIYEEIKELDSDQTGRYCELLSKILVKKHLYYENKNSSILKMGMLIPGLKGIEGQRWYCVSDILDTGLGKFAYRLVPATDQYASEMPDILLYRSSATLPTSMDAFTSYLNDINLFPPGYLSKNHGCEKELNWMTTPTASPSGQTVRPLLITGHSLGASNSQLALLNLQKSGLWPNREISVELFDSPAITAKDAKDFAKWFENQDQLAYPLKLNYYVSQGDPVPYAGSSYIGSHLSKISAVVHQMELTEQGMQKQEITGLGPHGRIFFRGDENVDFIIQKVSVDQFRCHAKSKRLVINLLRGVGSFVVWPTLGFLGGTKRFIWGRRHHDPIFLKILSLKLK